MRLPDDRPDTVFPPDREAGAGTRQSGKPGRRSGDWAVQWLFPAMAGGWSAWTVATTPSGPNILRAALLFVLILSLDALLKLAQFRPEDQGGGDAGRTAKRAVVFLVTALLGYGVVWLSLLFVLLKLSG